MRNPLQIRGLPATDSSLRDGDNVGAVGCVDLSGTGVLHATGNAYVGFNQAGNLNQSGGALTVDGTLYVSGDGRDGDNPYGTGAVNLSGSANLTTANTFVGYGTNGSFTQSGGTHSTGYFAYNGPSGTVGTLNLSGGTLADSAFVNVLKPTIGGPTTIEEGTPYTLQLHSTSNVGTNAINYWNVQWGDSGSDYYTGSTSGVQHNYAPTPANYSIQATAYGGGHTYSGSPVSVLVTDVPADLAAPSNVPVDASGNPSYSVDTGSNLPVSFTFADPGVNETHTARIQWGDGDTSIATVIEQNGTGTVSDTHTYATHGSYTAVLVVTDSLGATSQLPFDVVAKYVTPILTATPVSSGTIATGQTATIQLQDFGPEINGVTEWTIDWGDGSEPSKAYAPDNGPTPATAVWTVTHLYTNAGTYAPMATARDAVATYSVSQISNLPLSISVVDPVPPIPSLPVSAPGDDYASDLVYSLSSGFVPGSGNVFEPPAFVNETLINILSSTTVSTLTDSRGYSETATTVTAASLHIVESLGANGTWTYSESLDLTAERQELPAGTYGTTEGDTTSYDYTFSASGSISGTSRYDFSSNETYNDAGSAEWPDTSAIELQHWSQTGSHLASIDSSGTNDQSGGDLKQSNSSTSYTSAASGFTFSGTESIGTTGTDTYSFTASSGTRYQSDTTAVIYSGSGPYSHNSATGTITGNATELGSDNSASSTTLLDSWNAAENRWVKTTGTGEAFESIAGISSYSGNGPTNWSDSSGVAFVGLSTEQGSDSSLKVYDWILGLTSQGTMASVSGTGVLHDSQHEQGSTMGRRNSSTKLPSHRSTWLKSTRATTAATQM